MEADEVLAVKPSDLAVLECVGEKRGEAEAGDGGGGEPRHKIAADAVAGVVAGFDEGDGDAGAAKGEGERKAGEAAANNLNRTWRIHAQKLS